MNNNGSKIKYLSLLISPVSVMAVMLTVFALNGFYPFGERTVAWADMNQQVVPLMCQFKDILDGKSGMFLSFKNSSGMNFWGVFFFFMSSPLTLLVKFVDKQDMLIFMNILVMIKSMLCSLTASLYFIKSRRFSLAPAEISLLGHIYALCGYTMLFYQNVIWLDAMYLFPLLLLSIEYMFSKPKYSPLPYIFIMAAVVCVHYYLGYMAVIFVLLFAALYAFGLIKQNTEEESRACLRFIVGSGLAAMLSAVVWLPSFMQYMTSGRKTSLLDNLRESDLVTDYDTVFPVVMCSSALIVLAAADFFFTLKKAPLPEHRQMRLMTALTLLPVIIEPINKMWHTGSYMAFPARYAFMTVFMLMILAAYTLSRKQSPLGKLLPRFIISTLCAASGIVFYTAAHRYTEENISDLSNYTRSLGGDETSFKGLCRLLIIGLLVCTVIYIAYRKAYMSKRIFIYLIAALTLAESGNNVRIYMTSSGIRSEDTYALQREILQLSDRIDDDSFYRVKTSAKIFDYNMIGAMDYNSIGSYTSLNDEDYLFTMKKLGYTSVWMEIGTCGGTELTDSMLTVGYQIDHDRRADTLYTLGSYNINSLENKLPLGICLDSPPPEDISEELPRADVQSLLSKTLFGEDIITKYAPDEGEYYLTADGKFSVYEDEVLVWRIPVVGEQTLYFDCFDRFSTDLSEEYYDSFMIRTDGEISNRSYPYSKENGVLKLGTFRDETVTVEVTSLKDCTCRSFGVFGLDTGRLGELTSSAQTCSLSEIKNGLAGTADLDRQKTVLLSLPYTKGFTLKVNGAKVPSRRVLSCFTAFELPTGHSEIELTFRPHGFTAGLALTIAGALLTVLYLLFLIKHGKAELTEKDRFVDRICTYLTLSFGVIVLLAVYILPFLITVLSAN